MNTNYEFRFWLARDRTEFPFSLQVKDIIFQLTEEQARALYEQMEPTFGDRSWSTQPEQSPTKQ